MSINLCIFTGRLTKDVELKQTNNGTNVCSFTLAVNKWTKDGNKADFIDFTAWDKQAEVLAKYLQKGDLFMVVASATPRVYETKDGGKRRIVEFTVKDFELPPKNRGVAGNNEPSAFPVGEPFDGFAEGDSNDDLPF